MLIVKRVHSFDIRFPFFNEFMFEVKSRVFLLQNLDDERDSSDDFKCTFDDKEPASSLMTCTRHSDCRWNAKCCTDGSMRNLNRHLTLMTHSFVFRDEPTLCTLQQHCHQSQYSGRLFFRSENDGDMSGAEGLRHFRRCLLRRILLSARKQLFGRITVKTLTYKIFFK